MRRWSRQIIVACVVLLSITGTAHAEWQQSTNYGMNESEVGAGGDFNGQSSNYSFQPSTDNGGSTLGENAIGNSASTSYQSNGGFSTSGEPGTLTLCVGSTGNTCADITGSSIDLGNLSVLSASTTTAKFGVRNYTSYGYAVTLIGTPPTYAGHPLTAMGDQSANSTTCAVRTCTPGTPGNVEQFGINLTANTNPATFGLAPVQTPSGSFSYGAAAAGYSTADKFRFFSGDTIASATKSSGETDYTISFMANITPTTPGGKYTGAMTIVATGTY